MRRKEPSRVAPWVRILLLVPIPIIAILVFWAGQTPRQGLFESALSAQGLEGSPADRWAPLPAYLPGCDFTLVDTIQHYDAGNLYEKINGHDVAFFRFGFVGLTFASYSGDGEAFADVYAYRMDRRENALGIFANERSEPRESIAIRDAGYRSSGAVFFYRGPWYVQIIPSVANPETGKAVAELTDSLRVILPEPSSPLPQLSWFPKEGMVATSHGFLPSEAFGADFMGEVFTAEYESGEGVMRAFRHASDSAVSVYSRFVEFLGERASAADPIQTGALKIRRFSSYGEETWVALVANEIVGIDRVTDSASAKTLFERLAEIARNADGAGS